MFGISRDMRREARDLVAQERALERMAQNALDCPIYSEADLIDDINAVLVDQVMGVLEGIDLEALSGGGVRVGALAQAGYRSVGDVVRASERKLCQIPGVGDQTAHVVWRRARAALDEASRTMRVHFDIDLRPASHTQLLRNLYRQERLAKYLPAIEQTKVALRRLSDEADAAERVAGILRVLTSTPDVRSDATEALGVLRSDLPAMRHKVEELGEVIREVMSVTESQVWSDFERNAASYYARISLFAPIAERLRGGNLPEDIAERVEATPLDTSLMRSTLRPYQAFGARFALLQGDVLIGDEMGLGKTVEALAVMAHRATQGATHFAVVCPLSVLVNWTREVPRHSALSAVEVYGDDRDARFAQWVKKGGVAITTYETVQRLDWAGAPKVDVLVVDEAHYIKNPEAKRTKAVAEVMGRSASVMLLTGTPLQNRVGEMTALVRMLDPKLAETLASEQNLHNPVSYRHAIAPRYLRRTREDVLAELPPLVEKDDWCVMGEADREDYLEALREGTFADLRQVGWRHDDLGASAKATRLRELVDEARAGGRKVLVYSYFLHTLDAVVELLGDDCAGVVKGSVPARERQRLVDDFAEGSKTVLACQITAGGQGLNIQAASVVVFCEPQLKPAAEEQAVGRAYRMGQVRTVVVHRLLMQDTVDERIDEALRAKAEVFDQYADRSEVAEQARAVVDTREIREIIAAELKRHNVRRDPKARE